MLWAALIIGGMVSILLAATYRPAWFDHVWESTFKDVWLMIVGATAGLWKFLQVHDQNVLEYLRQDETWKQLVAQWYSNSFVIKIS